MDIHFTFHPKASDIASIYNGLVDFNSAYFPDLNEIQFGVFVHHENGDIAGGLTGRVLYTTLQINYLWLSKAIRTKAIGKALLKKIENEAKKLDVTSVCVDTYNFQAPGFYQKLGFTEVGRYINYPREGIDKIFLQKSI